MERLPNGVQFRPLPRYGSPPTLRTGYVRVLVFCNSCRHQADADLLCARASLDAVTCR